MMMMMALCSVVLVPMLSLSTFWKCVLVGVWIVYQMVERKNQFVKPSRSLAIVVTGADSGFGKEISIRLANRGFTVFAGMLQKKRNNNKNIIPLQMDVTSFSEVRDAFDRVRAWCDEEKRHVLCVINNAGVQSGCLVEWTSMKDYEMMFQVNTLGTIRVTKTFLPLLFRDSNCMYTRRIVNVTSVNGIVPLPGISGYAASKHATEAFTNVLRWELEAYRNIKVVNVNPGTFKTPMTSNASSQIRKAFDSSSQSTKIFFGEEMIQSAENKVRGFIGHAGDPVEVVNKLEDAATSLYPKSRYYVGWDARSLWRGWYVFVPHVVRDFILTFALRSFLPPSQDSKTKRKQTHSIFSPILFLVFVIFMLLFTTTTRAEAPPRNPPDHLLSEFTLNHHVPIESFYVDDSNQGLGTHYKFSLEYIENAIKAVSTVRFQRQHAFLFHALEDHSIEGDDVAIYGSMEPVFEALALSQGAKRTITIEFNKLTFEHDLMITRTVQEEEKSSNQKYDSAFSISSFDHTGLGRYNDPLNPNGDIESMNTVFDALRPGGILFLTIPIGPDRLVWNLMRIYGEIRLPLLLGSRPWIELGRYGWDEHKLTKPVRNWRRTYEPVFVLQKPPSDDGSSSSSSSEL